MFGLWNKKNAVQLNHWRVALPDFRVSVKDFYAGIRKAIEKQEIPNLEVSTIGFPEGGRFSPSREGLRVRHERFVYDLYAAPYGTHWYFSNRMAEIRIRILRLWQLLLLVLLGIGVYAIYPATFGGLLGTGVFIVSVFTVLMILAMLSEHDLDAVLLSIPVVGTLYEWFFRRETDYRYDIRLMFFDVVDSTIRSEVERVAKAQGVDEVTFHNEPPPVPAWLRKLRLPWSR